MSFPEGNRTRGRVVDYAMTEHCTPNPEESRTSLFALACAIMLGAGAVRGERGGVAAVPGPDSNPVSTNRPARREVGED